MKPLLNIHLVVRRIRAVCLLPLLLVGICLFSSSAAAGNNTVFIISMDGIRPDYIERSDTLFIDAMRDHGAYSLQVMPVFPSVTFQSHSNIATGTLPQQHGVTLNSFYDRRTREFSRFAGDQALLEAEPIWTTATRQGVRTLVLDWVKAHNQQGPYASAYFGMAYTRNIADEARVERVLTTWESDLAEQPLRLVMAYTESPDTEGHNFGPDAPEIESRMQELDALLAATWQRVRAAWQRSAGPEDQLYFIVLSDHGMAAVHAHVDLRRQLDLDPRVVVVYSSTLVHFFVDQIDDADAAAAQLRRIREQLAEVPAPITVLAQDEFPARWGYRHPYRTGDLIAKLPAGYTFYGHDGDSVVQSAQLTGRYFGAHGYDPVTTDDMHTVFFAMRYPEPLVRQNLGPFTLTRIHATLAQLLGIEPSPQALNEPLPIP